MSNDLASFLAGMREEGQKHESSGGLGIVGQTVVEFGHHRAYKGQSDFWQFWSPVSSMEEIATNKARVWQMLRDAGHDDAPNFGVRVTVLKDVLSRDDPYKKDLSEFVAKWNEKGYALIEHYLDEIGLEVGEIGKPFYAQLKNLPSPYHVELGEAGKTGEPDQEGNPRFPTIRVPVRKFANEAEARAFVDANSVGATNSAPFSAKAMSGYTAEALQQSAQEISEWLGKAKQGTPFNNDAENFPLPTPPTPPALKKYIAEIYQIEPGDIDLLKVDVPFG